MAAGKRYGIRLVTGGASSEAHVVAGLRGLYRSGVPTPVGQEGDPIEDLDEARKLVKDRSDAVELVEIASGEVRSAEAQSKADVVASRNGLAEAQRDGRAADDKSRFKDEEKAVKETI